MASYPGRNGVKYQNPEERLLEKTRVKKKERPKNGEEQKRGTTKKPSVERNAVQVGKEVETSSMRH